MSGKIGLVTMTLDKWELGEICREINNNGFEYEIINDSNFVANYCEMGLKQRNYHAVLGRVERPILNQGLTILKSLEIGGEKVYNNSVCIQIGQNKAYTSMMLTAKGVPHPKTYFSFSPEAMVEQIESMKLPLVLKPWIGGRGVGIVKAEDMNTVRSYIEILSNVNQPIYIQEYVQNRKTRKQRDMRVFVVGGEVLGVFCREASTGGWKTNICNGGIGKQCTLTPEIESLSIQAMQAIHADIGGVDIIESDDGYSVLEVNVCPLFGGFYKVTGINPSEKIAALLCSV